MPDAKDEALLIVSELVELTDRVADIRLGIRALAGDVVADCR